MTSKYDILKLSPRVAEFAKVCQKLAARKAGVSLEELATHMGWTKNATSHRLSHLRAAGLTLADGSPFPALTRVASTSPTAPRVVKTTPAAQDPIALVEQLQASLKAAKAALSAAQKPAAPKAAKAAKGLKADPVVKGIAKAAKAHVAKGAPKGVKVVK